MWGYGCSANSRAAFSITCTVWGTWGPSPPTQGFRLLLGLQMRTLQDLLRGVCGGKVFASPRRSRADGKEAGVRAVSPFRALALPLVGSLPPQQQHEGEGCLFPSRAAWPRALPKDQPPGSQAQLSLLCSLSSFIL